MLFLLYRWGNQSLVRLITSPKDTHLGGGKALIKWKKKIHVVWDSGHQHHRTLQKWQLSFPYRDIKYYGRSRGKHEPALDSWVRIAGKPWGGQGLTISCPTPRRISPLPSSARISVSSSVPRNKAGDGCRGGLCSGPRMRTPWLQMQVYACHVTSWEIDSQDVWRPD